MDTNRLEQFRVTKKRYDKMPQPKEFIILTRQYREVNAYLKKHRLLKDVRLIKYVVRTGFNPSKAFNIGVREAKYDNIIITSPEVKPVTDVLQQLSGFEGKNIVCNVDDEDADGKLTPLVNKMFRADTPGMYFLAMFNKKDLKKINGWDEDFMKGYAYEDNDFGERFVRAGLKFQVVDEIKAIHQFHPRSETIKGGITINLELYNKNTAEGVTRCKNGLVRE